MEDETLKQCAYHESARIVYAYQAGFSCDELELSSIDAGAGRARLNAGDDTNFVQAAFSGSTQVIVQENPAKGIDIGKKLMKILCAGACATNFLENGLKFIPNTELEVPGQDIKYIDQLEGFLQETDPDYPENFVQQTMLQIFDELENTGIWKAIDVLAHTAIANTEKILSGNRIEEALTSAGFEFKARKRGPSLSLGLSRNTQKASSGVDEVPVAAAKAEGANTQGEAAAIDVMLEMVLSDFLKKVKNKWGEEELEEAVAYLKGIFVKFKKY